MRAHLAAAAAALLVGLEAGAQDVPTVTEADYLAPSSRSDPALAALREDLAEAEAAAIRARTLANPELGVVHEVPGSAEQLDVTVSWRLPHPHRRRLEIAAADARVGAARQRLLADESAVRSAMREAYARWAVAEAARRRTERRAGQIEGLAERERSRATAGESSGLDARRLALAAAEARAGLALEEARRQQAAAGARVWRPDLPANAVPVLPPLPPPVERPTADHPRVAALRSEVEAAKLTERLSDRVVDMPEVVGGWQRQDAGAVAEGPIIGVSWPLPLRDRQRAGRFAARARREALEARLTLAERETAGLWEGTLDAYSTLRTAALAAEAAAVESATVEAAATAAFQAGEAALTDLLDTLRAARDAELAALELRAEALALQRTLDSLALRPVGAGAAGASEPTTVPPDHPQPGDSP